MSPHTIFITGAEGVGKSSIIQRLKQYFYYIDIHDFDEVGVPKNPPLSWRLDTTKYWIKKAIENQSKGISTCILGLCFPEEVKSFDEFKKLNEVIFCLLDIDEKEREKRLIKRNASKEVIEDTENLYELKRQIKKVKGIIINVSRLSINETFEKVKEAINKLK